MMISMMVMMTMMINSWDHYTVQGEQDACDDDDEQDDDDDLIMLKHRCSQNPEQKTGVHATPDDAVFHALAGDYAQRNPGMVQC